MFQRFENLSELFSGNPITRRGCLRFLMGVGGLFLAMPLSIARAAGNTKHRTIVDRFRGEELIYQIGFWLISHCGDANTSFLKTDIRKKMKSLALQIVSFEEQKKNLKQESNKTDKDFFLQFQVSRQDVSSGSGEVAGWLSSKAIPVKGTIKDVIFFGDLWGELIETRIGDPSEIAAVPDFVKNQIHLP